MPNNTALPYSYDKHLILIRNIFFNPKNSVEINSEKSSGVYKFCKHLTILNYRKFKNYIFFMIKISILGVYIFCKQFTFFVNSKC